MQSFAVAVEIETVAGSMDEFMAHMRTQASASLKEPGCRVFEIWTDNGRSDRVFLWEVYDDRAAFDAHLATPHFKTFDNAVASLVADKQIATWGHRVA